MIGTTFPDVQMNATPRKRYSVPSVAMNGAMRTYVTSSPLTRPSTAPMTSARPMAAPMVVCGSTVATAIDATAMTPPTDRSSSPAVMSSVMPHAASPTNDAWKRTFERLPWPQKDGRAAPTATHSTSRTTTR